MLSRLDRVAACLAAGIFCVGCCGNACNSGCRGPSCGKSPYAYMKYDCNCEMCGPGFSASGGCCSKCGGTNCSCGAPVKCGDGCGDAGCQGGCGAGWFERTFCCCTGCGELYWNEWYNNPPSRCEPCDCFGNYTGCGCCGAYQAPYRSGCGCTANALQSPPPLELADKPIQVTADAAAQQASIEQSDQVIDQAAAAGYDDSDLDSRLQ